MQPATQDPRDGLRKNSGRRTIDGVLFESWRTGILRSKWVSADGRIEVWSNSRHTAYHCAVDGALLLGKAGIRASGHIPPKAFRSQDTAMRAGIARANT